MSIKKIKFFTPKQIVLMCGNKTRASELMGIRDPNWNRDTKGKLIANIGDHYFFVKDNEVFHE